MPIRDRAMDVLPTSEARRTLPKVSREFSERGADAEPVFFGAHRKPAGVMLSYARYLQLLDQIDDMAIELVVRDRDRHDDGARVELGGVLVELGFDRAELEARIAAADRHADDSSRQPERRSR